MSAHWCTTRRLEELTSNVATEPRPLAPPRHPCQGHRQPSGRPRSAMTPSPSATAPHCDAAASSSAPARFDAPEIPTTPVLTRPTLALYHRRRTCSLTGDRGNAESGITATSPWTEMALRITSAARRSQRARGCVTAWGHRPLDPPGGVQNREGHRLPHQRRAPAPWSWNARRFPGMNSQEQRVLERRISWRR